MAHYFSESIFIVCISIVLNTVAELVSYIFVYGTDKYRNAKNSLSKVSLELAKKKDQIVSISEEKKHKKAIQKLKEEESTLKRNLTGMTTRINMICSMVLMMMMGVFRSAYSGVVVAKLPFEPIALFRGIFRAGLKKSTDPRDCCMTALYILCNMSIRQTIKMLFGTQPPRTVGGFSQFMEEAEEKAEKYYKND